MNTDSENEDSIMQAHSSITNQHTIGWGNFRINLYSALLFLLLTSTGNLPNHSEWKKNRWSTLHSNLGCGTTGLYSLFALHKISFFTFHLF